MIDLVEDFFVHEKKTVAVEDITYCLCIRVSDITPWIMERLEFCLSFYNPKPNIVVVDFGSEYEFAQQIQQICEKHNATYIYEDDKEQFSLARARNIAVDKTTTKYFMLSDIDFVFEKNIFEKLASDADSLNMSTYPKRFITMPICHLGETLSQEFWDSDDKNSKLKEMNYFVSKAEFGKEIEFYTPYSNVFFMNKELFTLVGGYCDKFRGHGSEDFDLMLRLGFICSDVPKAKYLNKDFYGPLKESFWGSKDYSGFRRYIEAVMFHNSLSGYQAYHMWHPKPKHEGYWTNTNDWKRDKFNEVILPFIEKEEKVLEVDYIPKDKTCLCLMGDYKNWRYFLPLKQLGYSLKVLSRNNLDEIVEGYNLISEGMVDLICIFNPYMKSHKKYKELCDFAKNSNVEVLVIERGGLPNTIYYANEVSYNDEDFEDFKELVIKNENIGLAENYINELIKGNETLESMESYEETKSKSNIEILKYKNSIFVPLQLSDDMAVSYFNEKYMSYQDFLIELKECISCNPNVTFVVKPHPLDKSKYDFNFENVVLLDQENIHAVIDSVNAILVYNSGVGLISLAHNKPVYSCGNAYYGFNGEFTKNIKNVNEIIEDLNKGSLFQPNQNNIVKMFSWLLSDKYSWFTATDIIRDFGERKSHAYDHINVEFCNIKGSKLYSGLNPRFNYSEKSYINSFIKIKSIENKENSSKKQKTMDKNVVKKTEEDKFNKSLLNKSSMVLRKVRKLKRDPKLFFKDFIKNIG